MPTLLQAENLSVSFGERILFRDVSFSINQFQKVALIARNGTGKTTLLNILAGTASPDTGAVQLFNNATRAYLPQEPQLDPEKTVFDEVYSSSNEVFSAIRAYESALTGADRHFLDKASEKMDALQAWEYETRIRQILSQLGLSGPDQRISELSGGQKKRVALAKVLITDPDFMILDEPTNHLDIEMIEWLEEYLARSSLTVLMVTHDRYFLERVCEEIYELDGTTLYRYRGNYSYFLEKQQERKDNESQEREKARNLLRREQEWVSRMPKARGTKSKARIDSFYQLKEKAAGPPPEQAMRLTMEGSRMGKKILELHDVTFSWNEKPLLEHFVHVFKRNEKAGIIGRNGSGKTTLLDIITGRVRPQNGSVEQGATISFGYYRQEGIGFDESTRVIDVVKKIADVVKMSNGDKISAAQFLSHFMFPYPTHQQFVHTLSGGEKRRLYLVTVLMQNPNFLILDEPTNDLDIITLNVLEEYLMSFQGCVLIVSHDRFFLDKIADHLFVFREGGGISDFPGNYSRYKDDAMRKKMVRKKSMSEVRPALAGITTIVKKAGLTYREQKELEATEERIGQLEREKTELEAELASGLLRPDKILDITRRYASVSGELEKHTDRWIELSEKKEEKENNE